MSAIDNSEVCPQPKLDEVELSSMIRTTEGDESSAKYTLRKPKRVLHFSDGTLEEYDDSDEESEDHPHLGDKVDEPFQKSSPQKKQMAEPNVNTKNLSWPGWFKHYGTVSGMKTLNLLDRTGESLAYYLGITTPKYQYEIDEYYRAKEEESALKKEHESDLKSWATSPPQHSSQGHPITQELGTTVQTNVSSPTNTN